MIFAFKRLFYIIFSLIFLVLFSPLCLILSMFIKFDSRGPIFFTQSRLGKNKVVFKIIKFRTMIVGAEEMQQGIFNEEDDPRVTKIGNFLRRYSLDEIPQMFNVLIGNMSIVGPRPAVTYELGNLDDLSEEFESRFTVKPGITGLAQISGRNELSWDEKINFDNKYINQLCAKGLIIDIKIIYATIWKVFLAEGSYEKRDNISKDLKRINKQ